MIAQLMCEFGTLETVSPDKDSTKDVYVLNGAVFQRFADFGDTVAYITYDGQASASFRESGKVDSQTRILKIAMPFPIGSLIYPAPVLWISKSGLQKQWKRASECHGRQTGTSTLDLDHLSHMEKPPEPDISIDETIIPQDCDTSEDDVDSEESDASQTDDEAMVYDEAVPLGAGLDVADAS